ncbi:hypothetical protein [Sedimentitalea nanhaiensis]|uniref:4-amino-4-deoxy-L-arabinose transferase n=1 Tax=Sedimentitalea nanhaiensis TaxID=999627 RepID=A0A1I7DLU1_9RHOB|nr:hypothetical protein [Sedimentitalea nanhaiensis]SFU12669.1 hypothetical protein SAMN05216236_13036 [Sedimentitalea nanhaiensis]
MTRRLPLLALWAAWFAALGALYLTVPVSPDQALFDYIAWSHLQGDLYYSGAVEQNFPGKMLMHELGIRLFGVEFWSFRAIDTLLLVLSTLAGAGFLKRVGFQAAPWVFLFLYPAIYVTSGYWSAGQRDIVAMGVLLGALCLMGPAPARRAGMASLTAGALVAVAVLIRPTYLSALAGLLVFEWLRLAGEPARVWTARLGQSLALCLGFAAVIGAVVWYGAQLEVLDDFYQQAILFNLQAYQVPQPRSRLVPPMLFVLSNSWHWIVALGAFGGAVWGLQRGWSRGLLLIVGLIAAVLLSYFAQNKGFGYHLGGLLPLMTLLIAVAVDGLNGWRRNAPGPALRTLAMAMLVLTVVLTSLGSAKKLWSYRDNMATLLHGPFAPVQQDPRRPAWADIAETVQIIRDDSAPDAFVLQWGRVFAVPFLAERRSSLRFFQLAGLDGLAATGFSGYEAWQQEIAQDLRDKPPAFALIDTKEVSLPLDPDANGIDGILSQALAGYRLRQKTPHYVLLEAPDAN